MCVDEVNKLTALINIWDNLYNWFDWIKQRDLEYRQTLRNAPQTYLPIKRCTRTKKNECMKKLSLFLNVLNCLFFMKAFLQKQHVPFCLGSEGGNILVDSVNALVAAKDNLAGPLPVLPTTDDGCRPAASNCWSLTSVTISLDEGGGDTASSLSCTKGVNIGSCAGSTKQMYYQ